mgnify:CR=1 FL=1
MQVVAFMLTIAHRATELTLKANQTGNPRTQMVFFPHRRMIGRATHGTMTTSCCLSIPSWEAKRHWKYVV